MENDNNFKTGVFMIASVGGVIEASLGRGTLYNLILRTAELAAC